MREILDDQLWIRFEALRASVMEYVKAKVQEGAIHKTNEGQMEISFRFPSYFADRNLTAEPAVCIHLYCYLLVPWPRRDWEWQAESFEEALRKAERDISIWMEDGGPLVG